MKLQHLQSVVSFVLESGAGVSQMALLLKQLQIEFFILKN